MLAFIDNFKPRVIFVIQLLKKTNFATKANKCKI